MKKIVVFILAIIGIIYAMPNFFATDYAVQVTTNLDLDSVKKQYSLNLVKKVINENNINYKSIGYEEDNLIVRLEDSNNQIKLNKALAGKLEEDYVVAMNLLPNYPKWLKKLYAKPMRLGLDLKGGVYFLLEVDLDYVFAEYLGTLISNIQNNLRGFSGIVYNVGEDKRSIKIELDEKDIGEVSKVIENMQEIIGNYVVKSEKKGELLIQVSPLYEQAITTDIIEKNIVVLRNRVDVIGVAEPSIQRQGINKIAIQLPGIQDSAMAKKIIGATANLEFRLAADTQVGARYFKFRDDQYGGALLSNDIIVKGDNVIDAKPSFDEAGVPVVVIRLDSAGGKKMGRVTKNNLGKQMAVVFLEYKLSSDENGVQDRKIIKEIISLATIQGVFGSDFRIENIGTRKEAQELAVLLRAGSLSAPIFFVEEMIVGPNLGKKNIDNGKLSVILAFALIFLFMVIYYGWFGLFADIALLLNIIFIVAIMSIIEATLTLPGIIGIVLTVGIAVDANVLIFARIKEQMSGNKPIILAVQEGYDRVLKTIFDANITTLIVSLILFVIGTGPIQGFAVTLSIGILVSMFTSIVVSRMMIEYFVNIRNKKNNLTK